MPPGSEFTGLVADLSTRFTGLPASRVDREVDRALERIREYLETDRISVMELQEDDADIVVTHSHRRPGDDGIPSVLGHAGAKPWYAPTLRAGRTIRLERIPEDLPPEAVQERVSAQLYQFVSHLAVPISIGGHWVCALATATCHESRTWSDETVQELRILGQILGNAIHRAKLETELRESLREVRALRDRLQAENEYLRAEIDVEAGFEQVVGRSRVMRGVLEQAAQVAETPASVLLTGETGVGKDVIARAIHARSPRRERAFVKVNCAALPPLLVESELFGHEKGAFTGAISSKLGRFEVAHEGTLFLDEIGELPPEVQAKLLRVLQDGEFERVGGVQTQKVDVRIIAATNRDLTSAIAEGRFREDLFYRLATFPIEVPPLRDHIEDLPLLVWRFVHRRGPGLSRRIERIPDAAMRVLEHYTWPGNVRELENVLERALILSKGPELRIDEVFARAKQTRATGSGLAQVERDHIVHVLEKSGWKINGSGNAAEILDMHPNTLRARMQKLGIARPAQGR